MLTSALKTRIEKLVGSRIETFQVAHGGYTPALRLVCKTAAATCFCKVGVTPLTAEFLRREIQVYQTIRGDFMPDVIAWDNSLVEPILIIQDLSAYQWTPEWTVDRVELTVAQINAMHATPAALETFAEVHGASDLNWSRVAADPQPFLALGVADAQWLETALPDLIRYEAQCETAGNHLTHCDLRSDNICTTRDRAVFVDWNGACLSNPKLDTGFWLPSLAFEGGPAPEVILPDAPEVAAWVSGFFAARAGLPIIPDAPGVRRVQQEQLSTALPWAIRALDLSPLTPLVRRIDRGG